MDKKEIKIKVGDTVIRYDGLKGKVIAVYEKDSLGVPADVLFETGEKRSYRQFDDILPRFYYLVGHTVLGNKAMEEELESAIKCLDYQIEQLKKEKAQLRKQLWRLKEEMVEDWRERKALRELRKLNKENQSTEENTED